MLMYHSINDILRLQYQNVQSWSQSLNYDGNFKLGFGEFFLLAISYDINEKNRVFGNICLSGTVEMIDFNPTPLIVLSS